MKLRINLVFLKFQSSSLSKLWEEGVNNFRPINTVVKIDSAKDTTVRRGDSGHVGRIGIEFSLKGCRWNVSFNWGYQGDGQYNKKMMVWHLQLYPSWLGNSVPIQPACPEKFRPLPIHFPFFFVHALHGLHHWKIPIVLTYSLTKGEFSQVGMRR